MSKPLFKFITVIPIVLYSGLIFTLSSFPQPDFIDLGFSFSDKVIHLVEYFVFGVLTIIAVNSIKPGLSKSGIIIFTLLLGALYGFSDEFHQYFVPGRVADLWDFVADVIGVALSLPLMNTIRNLLIKYEPVQNYE